MEELVADAAREKKILSSFPAGINFRFPWRKYQARVLAELDAHLKNNHLHVIAPPGSGKTILGLEVMLRLNQPTLILAPTLAIRNQWIQRFCDLFLKTAQKPDWISRDIRQPSFVTVVTYQALHAACNNFVINEQAEEAETLEEAEEAPAPAVATDNSNLRAIVTLLREQGVKTIVVDEAHHLKNEWWKTLIQVKKKLQPTVVGLTATPPYDVTPLEWQRYTDLNGPVDAEIFVPELVVEQDLCPHQDYVYFSTPTPEESKKILEFRTLIAQLFGELKQDQTLAQALEQHPIYRRPLEQLDWIYANLKYYSSILIFLQAAGKTISPAHVEVIGDPAFVIPELTYEWLEDVLHFYLFKDPANFMAFEEHQEHLKNKLRRFGTLEKKQINFRHSRKTHTSLGSSLSKLNSVEEIVSFEHQALGPDLRLVVLTDYIRKEFLHPEGHLQPLNKTGALPIFEKLRRSQDNKAKLGVLTGSVVILPQTALPALERLAAAEGITGITSTPFDPTYVLIHLSEQLKHALVHLVTQVFQEGQVEVLIGTKALLGEGWDAPCINTLVLATFVGSFVSSNQMRGRAIRTQAGNPHKTGNIWHLACLDATDAQGGHDITMLKRRFKSFVGVSLREEATLKNGIARLNLPTVFMDTDQIKASNAQMLTFAGQRAQLQARWQEALSKGTSLVEEMKIPFPDERRSYQASKSLYYNRTLAYLLAELVCTLAAFSNGVLQGLGRSARHIRNSSDLLFFLSIMGVVGMLFFGRQIYTTARLYVKFRDISKDFRQIGEALLQTLVKANVVQTEVSKLRVVSSVDTVGAVYCHLEGGTTFERSYFIKALKEMIGPVDNPRYVLVRKSSFLKFFLQKDYHSVPEVIGKNKALAEFMEHQWQTLVGRCTLIFTRHPEGRKLLLKARLHSLASAFEDKTEQVNKWR